MLERNGWRVCDALVVSENLDRYRAYIGASRGEFTVAKDQNIRLRSGWFSDRSATYLASGRPVITQETGFSKIFPVGEGLFAFSTLEEIGAAIEMIEVDYPRHRHAASEIAREYFSHAVVLKQLLARLDISHAKRKPKRPDSLLPADLVIVPASRWPTRLPDDTLATALQLETP